MKSIIESERYTINGVTYYCWDRHDISENSNYNMEYIGEESCVPTKQAYNICTSKPYCITKKVVLGQ